LEDENESQRCESLIQDACDAIDVPVTCPCFDANELASAVRFINSDDAILSMRSCSTSLDRNGLELTYNLENSEGANTLGYGSFPNACSDGDARRFLEDENESQRCESLIQDACDSIDVPVTCPCFDANDLALAVGKINNDTVDMNEMSCSTDSNRNGVTLLYRQKNPNIRQEGFGSYPDSCLFGGDSIRSLQNEEESQRCESLIQDACDTLHASDVKAVTCPCFDANDLALAVDKINNGTVDMDMSSCLNCPNRYGLGITYKPKNSEFENMFGYGSFPNSCLYEGDILQLLEDENESQRCESLIQEACDTLAVPVVDLCI